jgi:uncharacterized protein with PIN domain
MARVHRRLGDYAVAGDSLLFVGRDFRKTDIRPAI